MKSKDGKFKYHQNQYGHWTVRFYCEESRRRARNCQTVTERDNLIRAIKRQEPLDRWFPSEPEVRRVFSVDEIFPEWIEHGRAIRKTSESCIRNYIAQFTHHILPCIGKVLVSELGIHEIEKVAKAIATTKPMTRSYTAIREAQEDFFGDDDFLSLSYQREILIALCTFGKWAFERGFCNTPPFKSFRMPPVPEQPYDYWRPEDEDKFFDWVESGGYYELETNRYQHRGKSNVKIKLQLRHADAIADIVLFALRSGMRLGEIGYLKREDVDFEKGWVLVRGSYSSKERKLKHTTKGKKSRRIEMNADMRSILMKYEQLNGRDRLFNINRSRIHQFSELCKLAGVRPIHFHGLRHTCLTNLANGFGMDAPLNILKVQLIAGHSDLKTTQRYVHCEGIEGTSSRQWSREERKTRSLDAEMGIQSDQEDQPKDSRKIDATIPIPDSSDSVVIPSKRNLQLVRN